MEAPAFNNPLLTSYLQLAATLSADSKLNLIAQLSAAVKEELVAARPKNLFAQAFGASESTQTAGELIADLRASRTFTRQLESF